MPKTRKGRRYLRPFRLGAQQRSIYEPPMPDYQQITFFILTVLKTRQTITMM